MGGEELKWRQLAHHQLMSQPKTSFNSTSTSKTNDKAQISGRMVSSGIIDVPFAQYTQKNPSEQVDDYDYYYYYYNRKTIY